MRMGMGYHAKRFTVNFSQNNDNGKNILSIRGKRQLESGVLRIKIKLTGLHDANGSKKEKEKRRRLSF